MPAASSSTRSDPDIEALGFGAKTLAWVRSGWRWEFLLYLTAYLVYSAARRLASGDMNVAVHNGQWIYRLEQSMHIDIEGSVQRAFSNNTAIFILNEIYLAAQLIVLPFALIWTYRRSARVYRTFRNTVVATWLVAIPVYVLFPTAPPRLSHIGLVDTITANSSVSLNSPIATLFYNPIAAVPSLHCGFAFAISIAIAMTARRARGLPLLWGPVVVLAVVATGNHFILDVVAGWIAVAIGFSIALAWERFMPGVAAAARNSGAARSDPEPMREPQIAVDYESGS